MKTLSYKEIKKSEKMKIKKKNKNFKRITHYDDKNFQDKIQEYN